MKLSSGTLNELDPQEKCPLQQGVKTGMIESIKGITNICYPVRRVTFRLQVLKWDLLRAWYGKEYDGNT